MSCKLYERLISDENIFPAIKMVRSYVEEEKLLSDNDYRLLISLDDIWNVDIVGETLNNVRNKILEVIDDEKPFVCTVYFKPKKYVNDKPEFRPIHSANLVSQIAMIAMSQVLVFDLDENGSGGLRLSEVSRLIPSNFYGSRLSTDANRLFKHWKDQYSAYNLKANELLNRYIDTKEFSYEIILDLKGFFPSIDPKVIYMYIISLLPQDLLEEDKILTRKIVKQLLRIKLSPLNEVECEWYHSTKENCYVKGLPQGLPHTYFFSNLIMCKIQSIYQKHFPGEMLFYVDDSVIYTSPPSDNKSTTNRDRSLWFENKIDAIDADIEAFENNQRKKFDQSGFVFENFGNVANYKIQVNKEKSEAYLLEHAIKYSGERFLRGLCRETSKFGFDMYAASADEDIITLLNKTNGIIEAIEGEIKRLLEKANDNENIRLSKSISTDDDPHLVRLYRYSKYFKYRSIQLHTRSLDLKPKKTLGLVTWLNQMGLKNLADLAEKALVQSSKKLLSSSLSLIWKGKPTKEAAVYSELFDKGIIGTVIGFLYRNYYGSEKAALLLKELNAFVKRIEILLYANKTSKSYISAVARHDRKHLFVPEHHYQTLQHCVEAYYASLGQKNLLLRDEQFETKVLSRFHDSGSTESLMRALTLAPLWKWSKTVRASSSSITRELLYVIFTVVYNFVTEGTHSYAKKDGSPIRYCEIRALAHLRNDQFDLESFVHTFPMYFRPEFRVPIEYSLLQAMDDFERYVKEPNRIDDLIRVHKYCANTWKNGSKHLHFYTLHNQEHAVMLIQQSISLIHKIDYFKIKQIDYFVLFCACYLHDISMVTLPDYSTFYAGQHEKPNLIYTQFMEATRDIDRMDSAHVKRNLLKSYQCIDEYFENEIRSSHAIKSASEIRTFSELNFLESSMRDIIAKVSKAHCDDVAEVYHTKSHGHEAKINEKQIMILLRLADVLDISRYRISQVVLDHNLKNMSALSRFHWISHLLTDKHSITSEYHYSEIDSGESCLEAKRIQEQIILKVDVLMQQTTSIPKKACTACTDISSSVLSSNKGNVEIDITCNQHDTCNEKQCNFLCKWFSKKNDYLYSEFAALKNYLNRIEDNIFSSDVHIIIRVVGDANLSGEHFDYLKEHLERI